MKKIFIRSPYFIEVDEVGQVGSKVELYFYNKGTSVPSTPTYSLSKSIVSVTQTNNIYNISNYAKDFIKPIAPVNVIVPTEENVNTWCYVLVKRYKEVSAGSYTLIDEETIVCLNGYSSYLEGYNYLNTNSVIPLVNTDIKKYVNNYNESYINVWLEIGDYYYTGSTDFLINVTENSLYKLAINSNLNQLEYYLGANIFDINSEQLCEPIYTPLVCTFINRFGGWEYLTFFKANMQSIDVTSKDYNLLPSSINYNPLQGQKGIFNKQGKQKIKCNTGWVDENYSELIQDLLLSEVVLLENIPVVVKSQNFDIKTSLKDKNINYEIEFEFNYGLINDVI